MQSVGSLLPEPAENEWVGSSSLVDLQGSRSAQGHEVPPISSEGKRSSTIESQDAASHGGGTEQGAGQTWGRRSEDGSKQTLQLLCIL